MSQQCTPGMYKWQTLRAPVDLATAVDTLISLHPGTYNPDLGRNVRPFGTVLLRFFSDDSNNDTADYRLHAFCGPYKGRDHNGPGIVLADGVITVGSDNFNPNAVPVDDGLWTSSGWRDAKDITVAGGAIEGIHAHDLGNNTILQVPMLGHDFLGVEFNAVTGVETMGVIWKPLLDYSVPVIPTI